MKSEFKEYRIKDLFNIKSGIRITQSEVYKYPGTMPCITSQTKDEGIAWYADEDWLFSKKRKNKSVIVNEACVTWTKAGIYSGTLFYREIKFFPVDGCGVLIPKDSSKVNLRWFVINCQKTIYSNVVGKAGQGNLYEEHMSNIIVKIPSKKTQDKFIEEYDKRLKYIELLMNEKEKFENFLKIKIKPCGEVHKIGEVFKISGGNSGLSEEFIYKNPPIGEWDKIKVLSSSTIERSSMGEVSKYAKIQSKELKTFSAPCIVVARNGNAGFMEYIKTGDITINDHAYVFTLKKKWANKINYKWFCFLYQNLFFDIATSKNGNSTFTKEAIVNQTILIPNINIQNEIAETITHSNNTIDELDFLLKDLFKVSVN